MKYRPRIVDTELDELMGGLSAVSLEGPKAVGKTETALRRANTVYRLDDPGQLEIARAAPERIVTGTPPILIDEWQRLPSTWDLVRRAVDADPSPTRFSTHRLGRARRSTDTFGRRQNRHRSDAPDVAC